MSYTNTKKLVSKGNEKMSTEVPKYKTIRVTIDTWKKLSDIKVRMAFKDYNQVIVYLLEKR
jgi:hypothetical protein